MTHYKMSDVAVEVNDRENNPASSKYDRFVGLEHYVSGEVIIRNYGSTENLESTMKIFQSGDVLVARRNVYLKRASMVDFDGLTSGDSIVLRAKNPVIGRILPFVLNTDAFWDFADQYSDGTMSKRLSPKTLMTYEFDLPDEEELGKFADLLWAANDTRESYQALLRQTDELVKSQFIELFGDIESNPFGWKSSTVGNECHYIKDGPHKSPKYLDDNKGIPFISTRNVVNGDDIDWSTAKYISEEDYLQCIKKCHPEKGDILYSKGGTTGIAKLVKTDMKFANWVHVAVLKFGDQLDGRFFECMLNSDYCYAQSQALTKGIANRDFVLSAIAQVKIFVPPIELQKRYTAFVEQTDKSKFEIKKAIENTSALIKSLMQQDLTN